jgi:hypothetical protein
MILLLVFIIAVPLSVELFGSMYAVFDAWRHPDSRAAAAERLAFPLMVWGALWWWIGAEAWYVLAAAWVTVVICHVAVFYGGRWLIRRPDSQTIAIDTDSGLE